MAAVDASVAWNVMLGSEINAMAAGGMDKDLAREVYVDNPRVIMCGGGGPGTTQPRAERTEDGGVRVWGQSTFISGCHNATWCFMAAPLMRNGEMENDDNGNPIFKIVDDAARRNGRSWTPGTSPACAARAATT